ncbi:MAG: zinc metallopeptidase [Clostridia bacterium]|jgi:Zn-dependent membrane protease YugP|nr:zinc metallopeptidase [Clostridia bacterium]MDH7572116.1 zinc metallopeptidase [Clostridia bacterium]
MWFPLFDPTLILLVPAIVLALYAQAKVQSTYQRYLRVPASSGLTGAAVARQLLDRAGVRNVRIEVTPRTLGDHYDPRARILRLSPEVYQSSSLAAIGVAAHEAGHAIQHHTRYLPLYLRSAFVPVAQLGSNLAFPLLFLGIILGWPELARIGVYAFVGVVLFQLITLPVEFNASNRAIALLSTGGYVHRQEIRAAREVLGAAALTYLAAALMAVLNLIRLLLISSAMGGREE